MPGGRRRIHAGYEGASWVSACGGQGWQALCHDEPSQRSTEGAMPCAFSKFPLFSPLFLQVGRWWWIQSKAKNGTGVVVDWSCRCSVCSLHAMPKHARREVGRDRHFRLKVYPSWEEEEEGGLTMPIERVLLLVATLLCRKKRSGLFPPCMYVVWGLILSLRFWREGGLQQGGAKRSRCQSPCCSDFSIDINVCNHCVFSWGKGCVVAGRQVCEELLWGREEKEEVMSSRACVQ